jgi:hypothetical protein
MQAAVINMNLFTENTIPLSTIQLKACFRHKIQMRENASFEHDSTDTKCAYFEQIWLNESMPPLNTPFTDRKQASKQLPKNM